MIWAHMANYDAEGFINIIVTAKIIAIPPTQ